jgi:hypothetical protein
MPRRSREFDEDEEFFDGLTFNDDFVRYLVDEIYPPGTLGARTPAAEKFYGQAAAAHGENLELTLKYQEILTTRWRDLKQSASDARRQGLIARADAVNAVLSETVRIQDNLKVARNPKGGGGHHRAPSKVWRRGHPYGSWRCRPRFTS